MKRTVIYIAGFGDHRAGAQTIVVRLWRSYGVRSEMFIFGWSDHEPIEHKMQRLLKRIDTLTEAGYQVSLVGASAGAAAAINAFALRQTAVHRVVCICGALKGSQTDGSHRTGQGTFAAAQSILFNSVTSIPKTKRTQILSIRPLADAIVPPEDTAITGAQVYTIRTKGHAVSIGMAITVYSWLIIRFIKR